MRRCRAATLVRGSRGTTVRDAVRYDLGLQRTTDAAFDACEQPRQPRSARPASSHCGAPVLADASYTSLARRGTTAARMRACGAANAAGPVRLVRLPAPGAVLRATALPRVAIGRSVCRPGLAWQPARGLGRCRATRILEDAPCLGAMHARCLARGVRCDRLCVCILHGPLAGPRRGRGQRARAGNASTPFAAGDAAKGRARGAGRATCSMVYMSRRSVTRRADGGDGDTSGERRGFPRPSQPQGSGDTRRSDGARRGR